jgi:hypothetical protein
MILELWHIIFWMWIAFTVGCVLHHFYETKDL